MLNGVTTLRPVAFYARALRPELSAGAFRPARSRLLWLPAHVTVIALASAAIAHGSVAWPLIPLLSLAIGGSFAGLTFIAHEALHGSIVRGRRLRTFVGWLGFLPFTVSPRLWVAWHNRVHHGHTAQPNTDPDSYPTLAQYTSSRAVRVITDQFALGYHNRAGVLSVVAGFTCQSLQMLLAAKRVGLSPKHHRLAVVETLLGVTLWSAVAVLIGPLAFLFVYVLPLLVANTIVMTFILTNHSLSPHTAINDPLVNSLSVTSPAWHAWLTLGFGLHVEHHVFPSMSSRHAPEVRALLRMKWPERYQSMPFGRALLALMRTGRVYKTETSLVDPRSGREWPTLAPRTLRSDTLIAPTGSAAIAAPVLLQQVASVAG
jgi:fatty acid desaturase